MVLRKSMACALAAIFFLTGVMPVRGEGLPFLLAPGARVGFSPVAHPLLLKGIKVRMDSPLKMDFVLDPGQSGASGRDAEALRAGSDRLLRYFFAGLTLPEDDLWVNLSPYEKDRIIPDSFGRTEMGRDLLAQDYLLKQITASAIYPEAGLGREFWKRIYQKSFEKYGTTDIPVDTFNKVWIVPATADVYEKSEAAAGSGSVSVAYIVEAKLKVMLESDYLALDKNAGTAGAVEAPGTDLARDIIRQVIIPELEKEVNQGTNFTMLRQVYHSLILAVWYKKKIRDSLLSRSYVDRGKTAGVAVDDPAVAQKIWAQYVEAFKTGAFNYIKDEKDAYSGEVLPRKYFSGGVSITDRLGKTMRPVKTLAGAEKIDGPMVISTGYAPVDPDRGDAAEGAWNDLWNDRLFRGHPGGSSALRDILRTSLFFDDSLKRAHPRNVMIIGFGNHSLELLVPGEIFPAEGQVVHGVDINADSTKEARAFLEEKGKAEAQFPLHTMDFRDEQGMSGIFAPGSVDLIAGTNFTYGDETSALKVRDAQAFIRMLSPGGHLVLSVRVLPAFFNELEKHGRLLGGRDTSFVIFQKDRAQAFPAPQVVRGPGNETASYLDRHQLQWTVLRRDVMPELVKRARQRGVLNGERPEFRIADLGVSSAEETARIFYEMFQALQEAGEDPQAWDINIKGYDLDPKMIEAGTRRINGEEPFVGQGGLYADEIMGMLERYPEKFRRSVQLIEEDITRIPPGDMKGADLVVLNHVLRNFEEAQRGQIIRQLSRNSPEAVIAVGDLDKMKGEWWTAVSKDHIFLDPQEYDGGRTRYYFGIPLWGQPVIRFGAAMESTGADEADVQWKRTQGRKQLAAYKRQRGGRWGEEDRSQAVPVVSGRQLSLFLGQFSPELAVGMKGVRVLFDIFFEVARIPPQELSMESYAGVIGRMKSIPGIVPFDRLLEAARKLDSPTAIYDSRGLVKDGEAVTIVKRLQSFVQDHPDPSQDGSDRVAGQTADPALKGGIDLTARRFGLATQGTNEGGGAMFFDPAMVRAIESSPGLRPVIFNIQPLNDLPQFLGANP